MVQKPTDDGLEIFDDMARDTGSQWDDNPNRRRRDLSSKAGIRIIIGAGAVVFVLLIVLVTWTLSRTGREDQDAIKKRLEPMERKLGQVDSLEKKLNAIDGQLRGLQQSLSKVEGAQNHLREKMEKLSQQSEKTQEKKTPAMSKGSASKPDQKVSSPAGKSRFHEVRKGETLTQIARKYQVSVEQLCRLNGLSPNKPLKTGQKIIVGAGE